MRRLWPLLIVIIVAAIILVIAILLVRGSKTSLNTPGQNPLVEQIKTLTTEGGRVSWSNDGDLIAFDREGEDGYFDIWTMKPDGSDQECLTCDSMQLQSVNIGNPEWHPSGEYLVFQAQDNSLGLTGSGELQRYLTSPGIGINNNIWIMSYATLDVWQITSIESGRGTLHPHFSHQGDKLLWSDIAASEEAGQTMKLADFSIVNGQPQVSNLETIDIGDFAFYETHGFSPDDSAIIFSAYSEGGYFFDMEIYTLDLDTRELTQLTDNDEWDEHAHYSPDGSRIIYTSSDGVAQIKSASMQELMRNSVQLELWMMNADGSDKQRLTYVNDPEAPEYIDDAIGACFGDGSWSPEGQEFVVKLQPGRETETVMLVELQEME